MGDPYHRRGPLQGWWKRTPKSGRASLKVAGTEVSVPTVVEDLLVEMRPSRVVRAGMQAASIDMESVRRSLAGLVRVLQPRAVGMEGSLLSDLSDVIRASGYAVEEVGTSLTDRVGRAALLRSLIEQESVKLLPGQDTRTWELKHVRLDNDDQLYALVDAGAVCAELCVRASSGMRVMVV